MARWLRNKHLRRQQLEPDRSAHAAAQQARDAKVRSATIASRVQNATSWVGQECCAPAAPTACCFQGLSSIVATFKTHATHMRAEHCSGDCYMIAADVLLAAMDPARLPPETTIEWSASNYSAGGLIIDFYPLPWSHDIPTTLLHLPVLLAAGRRFGAHSRISLLRGRLATKSATC